MPKFHDSHGVKGASDEDFMKLQKSPEDEFGVAHINILYNRAEDKAFCFIDAPSKEAVEKHHAKLGYTCDWIIEVQTTA